MLHRGVKYYFYFYEINTYVNFYDIFLYIKRIQNRTWGIDSIEFNNFIYIQLFSIKSKDKKISK